MDTISFIFSQLRNVSVDTELLEACDWNDNIANSMIDLLNESFEKNKSRITNFNTAESIIREDLLSKIDEQKVNILLKVLVLVFENESKNLIDVC